MKKILFLLCLVMCIPAYAAMAAPAPFLSDADIAKKKPLIDRVERYLSGITTIASDFTQIAPDGSLTSGKFYLERPGKMRWQYNPPTPILMVANNRELVYYDYELEQVTYIPLDSTLVGFLAQEKIAFNGATVGIKEIAQAAGVIRITLAEKEKPDNGQLMLEFSDKPLLLRTMVVRDATNQVTTVSLGNAKFGQKLDNKLFVFIDPRKGRRKT